MLGIGQHAPCGAYPSRRSAARPLRENSKARNGVLLIHDVNVLAPDVSRFQAHFLEESVNLLIVLQRW